MAALPYVVLLLIVYRPENSLADSYILSFPVQEYLLGMHSFIHSDLIPLLILGQKELAHDAWGRKGWPLVLVG